MWNCASAAIETTDAERENSAGPEQGTRKACPQTAPKPQSHRKGRAQRRDGPEHELEDRPLTREGRAARRKERSGGLAVTKSEYAAHETKGTAVLRAGQEQTSETKDVECGTGAGIT